MKSLVHHFTGSSEAFLNKGSLALTESGEAFLKRICLIDTVGEISGDNMERLHTLWNSCSFLSRKEKDIRIKLSVEMVHFGRLVEKELM